MAAVRYLVTESIGRRQEPGGWNLIVVEIDDLAAQVAEMKRTGADGNPIELFQPAK